MVNVCLGTQFIGFAFTFLFQFSLCFVLSLSSKTHLEIVEAVVSHGFYFQIEYYLGNYQNSRF